MIRIACILFAVGALLGPVGDYAHVATGTTGYPQDVYSLYLLGIPGWVPILFGSAALAVGLSHLALDRLLSAPRPRHGESTKVHVFIGLALFLGLYVLSGFLASAAADPNPEPGAAGRIPILSRDLPDLVLATGALVALVWLERSWQGILLAAGTAISGTAVEIALVSSGAFHYTAGNDSLWGVASWLPWLYVSASVGVGNLARYLTRP